MLRPTGWRRVFFFNDTATTEIYTLSLHDALPICRGAMHSDAVHGRSEPGLRQGCRARCRHREADGGKAPERGDRKSTRLNSSHANISYAVFCLKKTTTNVVHEDPDNFPFTVDYFL